MKHKSSKMPPPIVFILLGILGVFGWYKFKPFSPQGVIEVVGKASPGSTFTSQSALISRFSSGERLLIGANASEEKQQGIAAYKQQDYAQAAEYFKQSLAQDPNDPETLIYFNNAQVAALQPLKIAVVVPIGSNLDVAQEMLRGVAQSQTEFNQQGGKLQVQIINDENNSELAKQIAQTLVKNTEILAVIGSNASNASLSAAPIYQRGKMVMITPTSTSEQLSNYGNYIFRAAPTTDEMANTLAEYVVKTAKRKNVAVCADSQAPDNVTFKDSFIPALVAKGGTHINTQCDLSAPDFNAEIAVNNLISSGAEAVLLAPHIDRLNRAIDLAKANNWKMELLGTFSLDTAKITQSGQGDLNGVVLPVPFHYQQDSAQNFTAQAIKIWGSDVILTWRTATSYDATKAIALELSQNPTREALQENLHNSQLTIAGANSQVEFLPSGDRIFKTALVKVKANPERGYYFELLED
jgi:branched-chain amino acid transport system substrate-binding protein